MEFDGILIMHTESGLPLFSKLNPNIDELLFSGLLSAIKSFTSELSLGGLSSFSTDKKYFYLTGRERITTCLIAEKDLDFKEVYSKSIEISEQFEQKFESEIAKQLDITIFKTFENDLNSILSKNNDIPFDVQVAEFVKKEFGENISYKPKLKNNQGKYVTVDLLVDNGEKSTGLKNKFVTKLHKSFSHDTTFVKVIDGVAGRAEVSHFFDVVKTFGGKFSGPNDPEIYNFFPRKIAVISKDYSPTVLEEVKKLDRHNDKAFIPATHILPTAGVHKAPDSLHCNVELWRWNDKSYPDRIFS